MKLRLIECMFTVFSGDFLGVITLFVFHSLGEEAGEGVGSGTVGCVATVIAKFTT